MGDMGDMYRDWDALKKERKAERFEEAMAWIKEKKIPFESKNNGYHLVIEITKQRMDFWPTTNTLKIGMRHIPNGLQYIQNVWGKITKEGH